MKRHYLSIVAALALTVLLGGCGYTTRSMVSDKYKTIYIQQFASVIDITAEPQASRGFTTYRPALETDITKRVVQKFMVDGNFRIARPDDADVVLKGKLADYRRDAVRYDSKDNVEEYRVLITVDVTLFSSVENKVLWENKRVIGETTYFLSGPNATSEEAAVEKALDDLARRVVERTVEYW